MLKHIFILIAIISCHNASAQEEADRQAIQQRLDSIQRIVMKDSLQVSDATITEVFTIRDGYFQKAKLLRADNTLTAKEREDKMDGLRRMTNENIQGKLGEAAYFRYVQMIRQRSQNRNSTYDTKPLAGANDN